MNRIAFRRPFVLVLAFLLSTAFPAFGQTGLVISQIYGGGSNSSATFNADFIELYNPTASPISTSGLSVQYASATGTFNQALALGNATIQPGQYFLVQTIASGTTGAALPTPDASGTSPNLSATAGKVALVNSTAALTGDTTCAAMLADSKILDLVGYGSTANCFLGSAPASGPSTNPNNTSVVRTSPTINTSDNSHDFSLLNPPVPHNSSFAAAGALSAAGSANPATLTSGSATLLTVTVTPGSSPASTGIAVTANLSAIGGAASQAFYDDGTHGDSTAGDNIFSFSATATVASSGAVSLPVSVTDAQLRTASASISLTVNLPVPTVAIDVIQGARSTSTGPITSTYVGQMVQASGIVTTVISNGFFIQTPDGQDDGNPLTPEGIEIFTSSKPTVAVGDSVTVTGTVQTFPAVTASHTPATEIASPTVVVNSHNNPLPAPVTLTASMLTASGGLWQLTPYEGMRVTVASMTAVSGTNGSISNESAETATTVGYFYAVIGNTARPFREPGIDIRDTPFTGVPANVAHFDDNPERILVNTTLSGGTSLEISTGAVVQNVTGVLDFTFSSDSFYDPSRLIVDATWDRGQLTAGITPQPVPPPASNEFTVASFNIERFYNTLSSDDLYWVPAGVTGFNGNSSTGTISSGQTYQSAAVDVTSAAYQRRLQKVSLAIRNILNTPDIVTLEEVENQSVAQDIASQINSDAGIANLYSVYSTDNSTFYTQDGTGISVGFLVKNSTVDTLGFSQFGQNESFTSTGSSSLISLNDRPWLVLNAGVKRANATDYPVTVIVNHMRSLSSINANTTSGANARLKKELQAEDIAKYIQGLQAAGQHVISGGDFNAFEFSDAYTDTLATYTNVNVLPADQVVVPGVAGLVTPPLVDLTLSLPANQRWSYVEDGNAQVLDHMVVTPELAATGHIAYAHINADFPLTAYNDAATPARSSDHDPVIGYFTIPTPVASAKLAPTSNTFGSFTIGSSSPGQIFTFTNNGETTIAISNIAATGDFAVTHNCPATLNAGDSCNANVVFTPTAAGTRNGALNVTTTNLANPILSATLSGIGIDTQGNPVLGTTAVLTAAAGGSYQANIAIKNTGAGTAHAVTLTGATLGSATGSPLPVSLGDIPPGASATAIVTFPASAGTPGAASIERYTGTYTGGTFGGSLRVTLPGK